MDQIYARTIYKNMRAHGDDCMFYLLRIGNKIH